MMKSQRVLSIDLLRGMVMLLMALDHVRMYFGYGTWYSEPTNLASTTPLLFFTRWITHFCAPVFVFLAGKSAYLYGTKKEGKKAVSTFLFTRGVWLVIVELVIVNFAWTFDITYSFRLLQVIWAIGLSMIVLSALVYLPDKFIFVIGILIVAGHNLLDKINVSGTSFGDLLWYALHQEKFLILPSRDIVDFVYPVLPWIGVMALGYVFGTLYKDSFDADRRRRLLLQIGIGLTLLFFLLRGLNLYGEPHTWSEQGTFAYTIMSFFNTTKYPPSLHFLLMTIGPSLIFLSLTEKANNRVTAPVIVIGKVPFFFYVVHLYFIHALAMIYLASTGRPAGGYVLSAENLLSGRLSSFGLRTEAVYVVWMLAFVVLYPFCRWYQNVKRNNPSKWWLSYL
jgi:uncharacterized membrane protein